MKAPLLAWITYVVLLRARFIVTPGIAPRAVVSYTAFSPLPTAPGLPTFMAAGAVGSGRTRPCHGSTGAVAVRFL